MFLPDLGFLTHGSCRYGYVQLVFFVDKHARARTRVRMCECVCVCLFFFAQMSGMLMYIWIVRTICSGMQNLALRFPLSPLSVALDGMLMAHMAQRLCELMIPLVLKTSAINETSRVTHTLHSATSHVVLAESLAMIHWVCSSVNRSHLYCIWKHTTWVGCLMLLTVTRGLTCPGLQQTHSSPIRLRTQCSGFLMELG